MCRRLNTNETAGRDYTLQSVRQRTDFRDFIFTVTSYGSIMGGVRRQSRRVNSTSFGAHERAFPSPVLAFFHGRQVRLLECHKF